MILIEVLVISNLVTFSPRGIPEMGGSILLLMQVIWAIGASMLVLAALQYLGRRVCLVLGLAIVVSHNLLDRFWVGNALLEQRPLRVALHAQMSFHIGPFQLAFVYPILAWIGDTTKYPPSLAFLLMTLGPAAMLCALADRWTGAVKNALAMFGRVPFAFYVAHVLLIHVIAVLLGVAQGFNGRQFFTIFFFYPKGYGVGLPGVYALWAVVIITLYPFCRWVAAVKARRRDWWLSYV